MARCRVKTEQKARRRSGLVLTRLPKPCDKLRDRAEERLVSAGTKTVQESCARRALLVGGRRPHRVMPSGFLRVSAPVPIRGRRVWEEFPASAPFDASASTPLWGEWP